MLRYRAAHFVRGNLVVAANGIAQDRLEALLSGAASAGIPEGAAPTAAASRFVGGELKVRTDLNGRTHLGLAFAVPAGDAGKPYAVLNALVAGRLAHQKTRDVSSFVNCFAGQQGGLFGVETSGTPSAAAEKLGAVVAHLKEIAAACPAEVEAAKQKVHRSIN